MKKLFAVFMIMAVVAVFVYTACAFTRSTRSRSGISAPESHPTMKAMKEVFAKQVEEGSKGKIKVELYPNGQLGGDRELFRRCTDGNDPDGYPLSSALAGFDKRIQALDLPYLFTSRKTAFEAVDGILGEKLNGYLAAKGILILGYQENGFRHVTARNPSRALQTSKA